MLPETSPNFLDCTRTRVHGGAFRTPRVTATPKGRHSPCCSSCHPHQHHGEGMSQFHLPGSDGRGCQSPFLPGPAAASHHKWVWPAKKQHRNAHTHSTKQLNTDQHHRESMVRDHGKLQQPQHDSSCVSSASCTQANSAFPVQGTWCLMATRGVTHTVCQRDCDEDSGGGKNPATNSKHSCSCMAPCPEHQPPGYC